MSEKIRLDIAMVNRSLSESREKAKALIMAGQVYVNQQKQDKAGTPVTGVDHIEVRGDTLKYVSRGGLKLEKAMQSFPICLTDKVCMDVGASTGGFTDCMLQSGASRVYAVDVGYGQLAWKLRTDERVVNLERTNVRHLTKEQVPEPVGFVSIDVAFISLKLVLPVLKAFLRQDGEIVALVKPQFEAGREKVGKKGVVRDPDVHREVLQNTLAFALESGYHVKGLDFSPVKGPQGNIEYLMYLSVLPGEEACEPNVKQLVELSHSTLDRDA
ncbi:TlyA family RNA methyltransferase [Candidatus Soleaferrea massiliensis]|uniref:TlyA family RNA methyltransferase n=1 Tax=Candidatus Soleaferrea massiliensis TaxID=1470354 RepID=UPI000AD23181|nr:TlyA family RNA methyltransferase [Candidatus Soleaferrea massiliensis]